MTQVKYINVANFGVIRVKIPHWFLVGANPPHGYDKKPAKLFEVTKA